MGTSDLKTTKTFPSPVIHLNLSLHTVVEWACNERHMVLYQGCRREVTAAAQTEVLSTFT